jgi:hypothetical protein
LNGREPPEDRPFLGAFDRFNHAEREANSASRLFPFFAIRLREFAQDRQQIIAVSAGLLYWSRYEIS